LQHNQLIYVHTRPYTGIYIPFNREGEVDGEQENVVELINVLIERIKWFIFHAYLFISILLAEIPNLALRLTTFRVEAHPPNFAWSHCTIRLRRKWKLRKMHGKVGK